MTETAKKNRRKKRLKQKPYPTESWAIYESADIEPTPGIQMLDRSNDLRVRQSHIYDMGDYRYGS